MRYDRLNRKSPDFDEEALRTYADLFAGGRQFRRNIEHYLIKNDLEPDPVFKKRCKAAHYINYAGPMAGFFAARLFESKPTVQTADKRPLDKAYSDFKEDCDDTGTDFEVFLGERIVEALIKRTVFWRVDFGGIPDPKMSIAEADEAGLRRPRLVHIPAEQMIDWRADKVGRDRYKYRWIKQHEKVSELVEFDDVTPTVTETWTVYRDDGSIRRWQIVYLDDKDHRPKDDSDIPEVTEGLPVNPSGELPIVALRLPDHLYLAEHVADAQLEHFRTSCAESWAISRCAYTMPWFTLANAKKPPVMGSGYYGILGFTRGGAPETIQWPGPSAVPFEVLARKTENLKDEIHRVAHQMARGVNNNAVALGRSALSKQTDNAATDTVLTELGRFVRRAIEDTFELIGDGRGEDLEFHIGGMDRYQTPDPAGLSAAALLVAQNPDMASPTGRRQLARRQWREYLPDLDEPTLQTIYDENDRLITETKPPFPPPAAPPGAPPPSAPPKATP